MSSEPTSGRMTTVVNIKTGAEYDVYIGRAVPRKRLKASIWANPFVIGRDGAREEVIDQYVNYLFHQPDLLARLPELAGKRLGCRCAPERCHGHILAGLADMAVSAAPERRAMAEDGGKG